MLSTKYSKTIWSNIYLEILYVILKLLNTLM